MQFIEFKEEHFSKDENTGQYFINIPKDEVNFKEIEVHQKDENDHFVKADYKTEDDINTVTVIMKNPADIRVNF